MCVRKSKGGEKKKRGGRQASREVHCDHANVFDRTQGHKDVMRLNFQNTSTPFLFQMAMTPPSIPKFDSWYDPCDALKTCQKQNKSPKHIVLPPGMAGFD